MSKKSKSFKAAYRAYMSLEREYNDKRVTAERLEDEAEGLCEEIEATQKAALAAPCKTPEEFLQKMAIFFEELEGHVVPEAAHESGFPNQKLWEVLNKDAQKFGGASS